MNDLTKYLVESILKEAQGGIKVMLPGGFKPPHEGHLTLAKGYADMPNVSEVVILITPKERDGITVQDAKQIWSTLLTGISDVKVEETRYPSPLMAAYEYVKNDAKNGETIALGASSKGDDYNRVRDFVAQHQEGGKYYKSGVNVVELPFESSKPLLYRGRTDGKDGQPISASQLRADLAAGDLENFRTNYPSIKSNSQIQTIYSILKKNQPLNETAVSAGTLALLERKLLKEGGAAGHMAHPYEDADLTFEDIENLIDSALTGQVEYAQEKLDGQNLMVTYKDGKVLSARNKGQLKNAAEKAMSKADMEASMAHLPDNVKNSFLDAMGDMEAAIGKLSPVEKEDYFGNGTKFVNMEVLHPASQNVAAYGVTELRMHNIQEYDTDGNVINSDATAPAKLQAALQRVEATKQSTYDIKSTDMVSLKKTADYEKQKSQLTSDLEAIRRKYNLSKTSKLGMYFQNAWSDYIKDAAKQYKYDIPADVLQNTINRWAFGSKTPDLRQLRTSIDNPEFQQWFIETDKGPAVRDQKKTIVEPVEDIFLKLGVFVLQSLEGLIAINPNDSIAKMKGELANAIESIKQSASNNQMSDDDASMRFLRHQLRRLEKIGGFNAILPTEGIVFKYNGKLYKLTGAFAPLNQIIGYIKFGRK